jgi:hypothetical protein
MYDDERRGWRPKPSGNPLVHGGGQPPVELGTKEPTAWVELDLAEPREVAALEGDDRGDDKRRLERLPAAERADERGEVTRARENLGKKGETKEEAEGLLFIA